MRRTLIYARFSTDLQSEHSVEDQIELCKAYSKKNNLEVVGIYFDKAKSGSDVINRPGLKQLLAKALTDDIEVILVEAFDRLSRDQGDMLTMHKQFMFHGIMMLSVHDGEGDTLTLGLRSLVGQLFREDNAKKVRRGLSGRIRAGLSAGGRSYGYRPEPGSKGKLLIIDREAEIVRRVFKEYVDGVSPRHIVYQLNKEGVPPPRGTRWNASTLNGNPERGSGILRNSLYVGQLAWNKET